MSPLRTSGVRTIRPPFEPSILEDHVRDQPASGNGGAWYRSGMDKVAVLVLIAVAAFVSSFVLTSVFAVRPLGRRWLSTSRLLQRELRKPR
jgi:hypothetical protein